MSLREGSGEKVLLGTLAAWKQFCSEKYNNSFGADLLID